MLLRTLAIDRLETSETRPVSAVLSSQICGDRAEVLELQSTATVDMDELQHRMKNMLSVVQALSRQTMSNCATKEQFDTQFSARLAAYCASIDRLIANNWQGLEINDLIRIQLSAFIDGRQNFIDGPELHMSTKAAHWLGLAIHELATNAVKYGSLSVPQGRVHIAWAILKIETGDLFHLHWHETGGPAVTEPTRRGFGGRLIQELIASAVSGQTSYKFHPAGVTWSLTAPASSALLCQDVAMASTAT